MLWHLSIYAWILIAATLVATPLGIYALKRNNLPGAKPFGVLMLGGALSCLAYAIQLHSPNLSTNVFWSNVQYLSYAIMPPAALIMTLQYTSRQEWITPHRWAVFFVVPLITIVLVWTNELHGLIRQGAHLHYYPDIVVLNKSYGPWFWVHTIYSYIMLTAAVGLLVQALLGASRPYREQIIALLAGISLVIAGNFLYLLILRPNLLVDTTLLFNPPAGLIMAWGLFRYRLFDLMPVAHHKVIENLDDGMLVIDAYDRLVDINPVAKTIFGLNKQDIIGQPMGEALQPWPELITGLKNGDASNHSFNLSTQTSGKHYEIRVTPISKQEEDITPGKLVILHEITQQKRLENELRRLSSTDSLTNVANRRCFFETLRKEILQARQFETPLSLAILDLDRFKNVNDTFGHQVGDEVLVRVAQAIRHATRRTDLVARYGGDEFVILLPHTDLERCQDLIDRLHRIIPGIIPEFDLGIGFSAGTASLLPEDDLGGQSILARADRSLYTSKEGGKPLPSWIV